MTRSNTHTSLVAVVTGASSGLGAGIAGHLYREGFAVGLCARRRPDLGLDTNRTHSASVDVRSSDDLASFATTVTERFGPIDLWINNAGVLDPIGPLRDADPTALEAHVAVNVLGVLWGTRLFARDVHVRDRPGTLVNITSGAARSVYQGWAPYCGTKAAVDQLTRVVAAEEKDHGLTAFAIAPGIVDTAMQALIRSTPAERFPAVNRFREFAETDAFNSPDWVAARIVELHRAVAAGTRPGWAQDGDGVVLRVPDEPHQRFGSGVDSEDTSGITSQELGPHVVVEPNFGHVRHDPFK